MVEIRTATIDDIEELVYMYYDLIATAYPRRKQTSIAFYYNNVIEWFKNSWDVFITYDGENITGFTLGYLDNYNGIIEPYYKADIAYVKEKYRNGRSAFLLYNTVLETQKDYIIETHALVGNASSIAEKYCENTFKVYERDKQ